MEKDFDTWNHQKKNIDLVLRSVKIRDGDIWWCSVGVNVGYESCGKGGAFRRPVLIIKKLSKDIFIGVPLGTQYKTGTWFCPITIHDRLVYAHIYQIKLFDSKRLQRRYASLDELDFYRVKEKLRELLEFS